MLSPKAYLAAGMMFLTVGLSLAAKGAISPKQLARDQHRYET